MWTSLEFHVAYQAALLARPLLPARLMPVTPVNDRRQATETILRGALRSARTRAKQKKVAFDIDVDFLLAMAVEQNFRCNLTGIEFLAKRTGSSRIHPYTPSIDRIVPALGYTKGNVRLVIFAVNAMLLDWGEELFVQIANSYRYWAGTKNARRSPAQNIPVRGEVNKV
jgi:hypothetical protein